MAIGVIFDASGMTQAQYDQIHQDVSPDNQLPPGMLYHAAGPAEGGYCVIETWESQEAAQQFAEQKLAQAMQRAGLNAQPKFFQVGNIMK